MSSGPGLDGKLELLNYESGSQFSREPESVAWTIEQAQRGDFPHFMIKEINEQATTIKRAIEQRLTVDPIGFGKPLRYDLKGHRRLRVSDYRIVYQIEARIKKVVIVAIKHRKDVYEDT